MPANAPSTSDLARGVAIALASAATLATTAIFIRHLTQAYGMPPLVLAFWRDGLAALALAAALAVFSPRRLSVERRHAAYLTLYGLAMAVFNALWTISVAWNGAAVATVLVYGSVGFAAILGRWLLAERLGWGKALAVTLSLGGCVLVSGALDLVAWQANPAGILAGVLSGLGYAVYSLMGRSASQRGLYPWTTLLYTFGAATLFLLFANLAPAGLLPGAASEPADLLWLGDSAAGWGYLVLLAAGPTVAGFGLYMVSLVYLPSSVANLIVALEVIFTAILAYVLLGERMGPIAITGGVLMMLAVVVLSATEARGARERGL